MCVRLWRAGRLATARSQDCGVLAQVVDQVEPWLWDVNDDPCHKPQGIELLLLDGLWFVGVVRMMMARGASLQRVGDLLGLFITADAFEADWRAHEVSGKSFETSPVVAVKADIVVSS